jgi:hypothetical protein
MSAESSPRASAGGNALLRKIAASTNKLKWMLRYIDFVVGKERL